MSSEKSTAPFINPEARLKITLGSLIGIVATAVTCAAAWSYVKADVQKNTGAIAVHDHRLDVVESKIATDHDILLEIRADVKAITRDRRNDERIGIGH